MARRNRSSAVLIAVDVEGAGRGPRFLASVAEQLSAAGYAQQLQTSLRLVGAELPPHTRSTFIREAIPRALERAKEALKAVPGASIGIGIAPGIYIWSGDFWSLSIAYAADEEGLLFGTTSRSLDDVVPDELLEALNKDANELTDKLLKSGVRDTPQRRKRIELGVFLCQAALTDLIAKVPRHGNGIT